MTNEQQGEDFWSDIMDILMEGGRLSEQDVSEREKVLQRDPESVRA